MFSRGALSCLLSATPAAFLSLASAHGSPLGTWHYLSKTLPVPLSDTSVNLLSGFPVSPSTINKSPKRILLAGGCDSPLGNEFVEIDLREDGVEDCGEDCIIEFFNCHSLSNKTFAIDPVHDEKEGWSVMVEEMAVMPRKRARHASVVVDGKLYLIGGRDEADAIVAEIDRYDPVSNSWSTPGMLPEEYLTSDTTAFAIDETIYLVGGYKPDYVALDQVTLIDVSSSKDFLYSSSASKLLTERGDIDTAVTSDGKYVFVSGGFTHVDNYAAPHNTVERYDTATHTWTEVESVGTPRGDKQLVALGDKLYAIGGEDKPGLEQQLEELPHLGEKSIVLSVVEVYDIKTDLWKSGEHLPGGLFRFAATEWITEHDHDAEGHVHESGHDEEEDGVIFVFGGQTRFDADCECFRTSNKILVYELPDDHDMGVHDEEGKFNASDEGNDGTLPESVLTWAVTTASVMMTALAI